MTFNDILTSLAGNIPTLIGLIMLYYVLRHLIRSENDKAIAKIEDKLRTLNALRNLR